MIAARYLRYLTVLLAFVVTAGAVVGFVQLRPLPVEVARVEADVPLQVFGLGSVEARVLSRVGFSVGGVLVELHADHGDAVKAGALIARLDAAEQQAKLAKATAAVTQAQAALAQASAQVLKAQAVLRQREYVDRRRQQLLASGNVSQEAAQEARADKDVAAAELSLATSQVDLAKANLEDAKAQQQYEAVLLSRYTLFAPYDAVVVERHKELGSALAAGESVFTLIDPSTVWARAFVDEASAGGIQLGQPAEVKLRSLPRQVFRGRIARIDIESDRVSEERRVYIKCEQCPPQFYLGEQAEVTITVAQLQRALLVPEVAVEHFQRTQGAVWTVENGRLDRREVRFGHRTLDGRVEIVEGLPADALVVTRLVRGLRVGRWVRVAGGTES